MHIVNLAAVGVTAFVAAGAGVLSTTVITRQALPVQSEPIKVVLTNPVEDRLNELFSNEVPDPWVVWFKQHAPKDFGAGADPDDVRQYAASNYRNMKIMCHDRDRKVREQPLPVSDKDGTSMDWACQPR